MSHYYSEEPISRLRLQKIRAILRGYEFEFYTASGVFSVGRIDKGTQLLVENMIVKDGWRILDLGCGYGVIGIVAAKLAPHGKVVMTDINRRALWLARMNVRLNKVEANTEIRWGSLYEPVRGEIFDTIITNPPTSAGLQICYEIIRRAPEYLRKGGLLQLVARHGKGGARLADMMERVFGSYEVLAKAGGYWVYASTYY
ncbi:MAG: 16S rRNA methyltransferase [Thermoprotei archaeon]|nr:MAG: 16S rRNA methyltransferase [Thermoprotei archaeon]RLF24767.1 MAG: 16S rRNA methyltransferase [Thermoprotei archaeon]